VSGGTRKRGGTSFENGFQVRPDGEAVGGEDCGCHGSFRVGAVRRFVMSNN
jgi:hypothetical protein